MLPLIELLAVISASIFGVMLARRNEMDFVGVFSIAFVTAFGGGTLRDVLLDRHPLFWLRPQITVLPAFSAFTGGHPVPRADSGGSVLCDGEQLLQLR